MLFLSFFMYFMMASSGAGAQEALGAARPEQCQDDEPHEQTTWAQAALERCPVAWSEDEEGHRGS